MRGIMGEDTSSMYCNPIFALTVGFLYVLLTLPTFHKWIPAVLFFKHDYVLFFSKKKRPARRIPIFFLPQHCLLQPSLAGSITHAHVGVFLTSLLLFLRFSDSDSDRGL